MTDELLLRRLYVALADQQANPVAREMAREVLAGRMSPAAAPGSLAYRDLFHEAFGSLRKFLEESTPEEIAAAADRDLRMCADLATDLADTSRNTVERKDNDDAITELSGDDLLDWLTS
jgi:hypothetical protein